MAVTDRHKRPNGTARGQSGEARWTGIDNAIRRRSVRCSRVPADSVVVERAREFFGVLPADYVSYLTRYGNVQDNREGGRVLLGLTGSSGSDILHAARILRALYDLDPRWIPIELLPDRQVACVDSTSSKGLVCLIELDRPELGSVELAPTLLDFIYDWLTDANGIASVIDHIRRQRQAVEAGLRARDQLDRPGDWTVTRMCTQDVVFGVIRGRHNREHNRYDVSVFATAGLSSFAADAPVRAALTSVLCDAYRCGGPLAVAFGVDGNGPIPGPLRRWATGVGVTLPRRGGWDAATGEKLYLRSTDLTDGTRAMLPLAGVSSATVCHAVASGQWPTEAVEALLRWSAAPHRILTGAVAVTDRLAWTIDRQGIRAALVLAAVARVLRRAGTVSEDDDSGIDITVTFAAEAPERCDASVGAVEITATPERAMELPWRSLAGRAQLQKALRLRILAVENHLLPDQLRTLAHTLGDCTGVTVIVPADANTTTDPALGHALREAALSGLHLLAAPDYTTTLDAIAERALARARTART
jgi:hypothetical protein